MVALEIHSAFLRDAAVLERPEVATLRLVGPDRVRFLNGMVSNDVASLREGKGQLAIKTSNRGRIEALLRVRARAESLDLDVVAALAPRVRESLQRFIIMDDCAIEDISASREVVSLFGPRAHAMLEGAGISGLPAELEPHAFVERGGAVVIRDTTLGVDGYELHVAPGEGLPLVERLLGQGAKRASFPDLDVLRVEAGVPLDGRDLDDDTIPMEARLERALSMTKGCYIGQEVIARATNLGGVKHILVGLLLEGNTPPPEGAPLIVPGTGDKTGELTSVVYSPKMGQLIALGFVHKSQEKVGNVLHVGVEPRVRAVVTGLPFEKE